MFDNLTYRNAFFIAFGLHVLVLCLLMLEKHNDHFVVHSSPSTELSMNSSEVSHPETQTQPIQAVSVDSQAVAETLNRLKTEREEKKQAELNHQHAMQEQLRVAQQQRVREQQRLAKMKKEEAALALAHQKQLVAEKRHLQELAEQKKQQEQHLAELKQQQMQLQKQQQQEKQRMADALQKQKQEETAKTQRENAAREAAAQLAAKEAAQRNAQQAAADQQRAAQMSGEVNKYKALIIQAISQHWILPDHVNRQLYSQFRIQLAPNGRVLSVSLIRSSGDPVLDRSAQAAIYKASPLPVPTDATMFNLFRDISLTVRPESTRG
jgi:colicin import membrane protein